MFNWCVIPLVLLVLIYIFFVSTGIYYEFYDAPRYLYDNNVTDTCQNIPHCGTCGSCSTKQDYSEYRNKSETLTGIAKSCALESILGDGAACFERDTELTRPCIDCWMENVQCTRTNCFVPCVWELMTGKGQNIDAQTLSKCFACDEYYCLEGFINCAGMSRRRAGVVTDIDRDRTEICNK
jgi:hypothetical protein